MPAVPLRLKAGQASAMPPTQQQRDLAWKRLNAPAPTSAPTSPMPTAVERGRRVQVLAKRQYKANKSYTWDDIVAVGTLILSRQVSHSILPICHTPFFLYLTF